jgi:hypothetical protein
MSTTTYFHPCGASFSAMTSACAFVFSSVTVVAKQSQLFQPMGGVGAQAWKSSDALKAAVDMARRPGRRNAGMQALWGIHDTAVT